MRVAKWPAVSPAGPSCSSSDSACVEHMIPSFPLFKIQNHYLQQKGYPHVALPYSCIFYPGKLIGKHNCPTKTSRKNQQRRRWGPGAACAKMSRKAEVKAAEESHFATMSSKPCDVSERSRKLSPHPNGGLFGRAMFQLASPVQPCQTRHQAGPAGTDVVFWHWGLKLVGEAQASRHVQLPFFHLHLAPNGCVTASRASGGFSGQSQAKFCLFARWRSGLLAR